MGDFQIFSPDERASLRTGGSILRSCLDHVASAVKPGITTGELDRMAEEFICSHDGAAPGFKGYQGFPATLCTSVNEECVHGMPGERVLEDGDIIAVDCGVLYDGLYTDACLTVGVGSIDAEAQRLLDVTKQALDAAVTVVRSGVTTGDISATVQSIVEEAGFSVVRPLTGHGLGSTLHQFPDVPNFGEPGTGPVLPEHTILAIEPIVAAGKSGTIRESGDGWTICTGDGSRSAHFEHTILVTKQGHEILA